MENSCPPYTPEREKGGWQILGRRVPLKEEGGWNILARRVPLKEERGGIILARCVPLGRGEVSRKFLSAGYP